MISPFGNSFTDTTWTTTPKEIKELWWNEFKWKFRWDEAGEKEARIIFKRKAGGHMRNVMNRAKRSQETPDFITADNRVEIKRTWDTEKHKQISEINKKNRASSSSEGLATYAEGSINIEEHRKRIADELGTEPIFIATFERTFQKKDKTWTSNRANAITDKYELVMSTTAASGDGDGDGDGHNDDDNEIADDDDDPC
ncbi:hypothetical protein NL676_025556 [Syzygium grande]|nr:hypothetical protein NL676_025556 [Syzygium grande]